MPRILNRAKRSAQSTFFTKFQQRLSEQQLQLQKTILRNKTTLQPFCFQPRNKLQPTVLCRKHWQQLSTLVGKPQFYQNFNASGSNRGLRISIPSLNFGPKLQCFGSLMSNSYGSCGPLWKDAESHSNSGSLSNQYFGGQHSLGQLWPSRQLWK